MKTSFPVTTVISSKTSVIIETIDMKDHIAGMMEDRVLVPTITVGDVILFMTEADRKTYLALRCLLDENVCRQLDCLAWNILSSTTDMMFQLEHVSLTPLLNPILKENMERKSVLFTNLKNGLSSTRTQSTELAKGIVVLVCIVNSMNRMVHKDVVRGIVNLLDKFLCEHVRVQVYLQQISEEFLTRLENREKIAPVPGSLEDLEADPDYACVRLSGCMGHMDDERMEEG